MNFVIGLVIGIIIGFVVGFLVFRKHQKKINAIEAEIDEDVAKISEKNEKFAEDN